MPELLKPDWIETRPGRHPALVGIKNGVAELTPEEKAFIESKRVEAEAAANSLRPDLWDEEARFIADCERRIKVARASLETFENKKLNVENRASKILEQRRILATALYQSGRYDEALSALVTDSGSVKRGCKQLYNHILLIVAADAVDDSLEHDCQREVVEGEKVKLELNRRHVSEQCISRKNQKLEWLWKCHVCGAMNLTDQVPERQKNLEQLRHAAYEEAQAQSRKMTKTVREKQAGSLVRLPAVLSDDVLLKS